jgi:hypothetical protein
MGEPSLDEEYWTGAADEEELIEMANTMDGRDFTQDPPAILDPEWVLMMRARVQHYIQTGEWNE